MGPNRTPLCEFESPRKKAGSTPASTILFYLHGPAHMGPILIPVALPMWVTYGGPYWNHMGPMDIDC